MDESGYGEEDEGYEEWEDVDDTEMKYYSEVPLILPRRSFKGISNLETIKDGTVFVTWLGMPVTNDWIFCSQLCRTK